MFNRDAIIKILNLKSRGWIVEIIRDDSVVMGRIRKGLFAPNYIITVNGNGKVTNGME